jgi:hypothetical protein
MIKVKEKIKTSKLFSPSPNGHYVYSKGYSNEEVVEKLVEISNRYPNLKVYDHSIVDEVEYLEFKTYWTYEYGSPARVSVQDNPKAFAMSTYFFHYHIIVLLQ